MNPHEAPRPFRRRRDGGRGRVLAAALLALLGHVLFVGLFLLTSQLSPTAPRSASTEAPRDVSLRTLSADDWARNRGDTPASRSGQQQARAQAKPPPPKPPEPEPEPIDGQVVATPPGNDQVAKDAEYLSESNNKVEKETRAREQTADYRNAATKRTGPQTQGSTAQRPTPPQPAGNRGVADDERPPTEQQRRSAFEIPDARKHDAVALKTDPRQRGPGASVPNRSESDNVEGNSNRLLIQPGNGGTGEDGSRGRRGSEGLAALMPSAESMSRIIGAAPNDHLRDVDEGDETLLNTREWKYATFFNRLKQRVGEEWDPTRVLRQRDPTGATYQGRDRHTLLEITLDASGRLQDVHVEKSSGLDFLDLEAVRAFERAQPFPNPPPGLVSEGRAVTFTFGFYLEMGGGPRMRLFRAPN